MINFNWKKEGIIFSTKKIPFKNYLSRAMLPRVILEKNNLVKIYYTYITKDSFAANSFFELNINKKIKIKKISKKILIKKGPLGTFDDSGTLISAVIKHKNTKYLFYNGYKRTFPTPYSINVGLCKEYKKNCFQKISAAPILERSKFNPYFITGPNIIKDKGKYKLWYTSGLKWFKTKKNTYENQYCIKYAESKNLLDWTYDNKKIIFDKNQAVAAPSVFKYNNLYHMIFCYRGLENYRDGDNSYRLGYAYSKNGTHWKRNDKLLNFNNKKMFDWEKKMQCYPNVIIIKNKVYMFYNGNSFGADGIALAWSEL